MRNSPKRRPHEAIVPDREFLEAFKAQFKYDPDTGELWKRCGYKTAYGYRRVEISSGGRGDAKKCNVSAHRLAWFLMTGEWPPTEMMVDHKNRIRDDNRWENLRLCNAKESARNRRGWGQVQSRGVTFHPSREKPYRAAIGTWPTNEIIGFYESEVEAARAYRERAKQVYGEFAAE